MTLTRNADFANAAYLNLLAQEWSAHDFSQAPSVLPIDSRPSAEGGAEKVREAFTPLDAYQIHGSVESVGRPVLSVAQAGWTEQFTENT